MIYIILGIIIGVIIGIADDFLTIIEKVICSIIFGFIGFAVGGLIWISFGEFVGEVLDLPQVEVYEEQEICALNDSTLTEGSMFLFSSYIEDDLVFRYVVETEKGKYIEEIKGVESVYIQEGNYKPVVRTYSYEFEEEWHYWFASPSTNEYTVFYVPENTVTNEYNINLN